MRKDPNFANFFKRIYNTSSGSKKPRPKASRSTTPASSGRKPPASSGRKPPASSGRKPPASAPRSTTPASASKTPSQGASSKPGAISRAQTGLSRISERSIYDRRIFPPSRSSTRVYTDMEEVD
jgi:hypothetical protein